MPTNISTAPAYSNTYYTTSTTSWVVTNVSSGSYTIKYDPYGYGQAAKIVEEKKPDFEW